MNHPNDEIERLIAAAQRDISPDPTHREALGERVLAEFDKLQPTSLSPAWILVLHSYWRWIMARPITRLGIPTALVMVISLVAFTSLPAKPGFALEKIIEPLLSARSGRCLVVVQMKDKKLPPFTFLTMFRGTAHRQENKEMGTVMIMDSAKGTIVSLNPKEKQAQILQQVNINPDHAVEGGFLQRIRELLLGLTQDKRITQRVSLGDRELADRKLIGYRIIGSDGQMDIWGDQETGLPYSIVSDMAAFPNMELTMTDFEFDIELDGALFSLTPPAGYSVTHDTMDMSLMSEKGFVEALRQFAEINGGVYPDSINAMQGIEAAAKYAKQLDGVSKTDRETKVNRVRKLLAAGFGFPLQLTAEADASYAGKGIHRDDAGKPIFWYKPEEADKYRVVFADLSIADAVEPPQRKEVQSFARGGRGGNAE